MITQNEAKKIIDQLAAENPDLPADDLIDEIDEIVYRVDVYPTGDTAVVDRHVDIEYTYGEYLEIKEGSSLFQFIAGLCSLPASLEEQETILWRNI